jgi:transposase InsO family protein
MCPDVNVNEKRADLFHLVGKTMTKKVRVKDRAELVDKLDARIGKREPAGWDLKVHRTTGMRFHDLRHKVFLARKNGKTVREVVRMYGVSAGFVSKWTSIGKVTDGKSGYSKVGFLALPMYHGKGSKVQDRISADVIRIRKECPWYGSYKIRVSGEIKASPRTIDKVLRKNRMIGPVKKRKRKNYIRFEREHSMSLVQLDYKQWPDGSWSVWALDDHSRMILGAEVTPRADTATVIKLMEGVIRRFGAPEQVLTDRGSQFMSVRGGKDSHEFGIWCKKNHIEPIHGRVGHPETQGKIERSHLSAIRETAHIKGIDSLEKRRKAILEWILMYNTKRPHQSLDYDVPVNVFLRDLKNIDAFLNIGVHEVCM